MNAQNIEGTSGLHIAATNGYTNLAELLIARGADVDMPNYCGWTPLMHAAQSGQVSMVSLLVKSKVNLNSTGVLGMSWCPNVFSISKGLVTFSNGFLPSSVTQFGTQVLNFT